MRDDLPRPEGRLLPNMAACRSVSCLELVKWLSRALGVVNGGSEELMELIAVVSWELILLCGDLGTGGEPRPDFSQNNCFFVVIVGVCF